MKDTVGQYTAHRGFSCGRGSGGSAVRRFGGRSPMPPPCLVASLLGSPVRFCSVSSPDWVLRIRLQAGSAGAEGGGGRAHWH
jgi:hypothetical protein